MDVVRHFRLTHDPFKAGAERVLGAGDGAQLDAEAARRFIATRSAVAGQPELFSPASLDLLAGASRGRPAALRLLAGNAMFHAAFDGAARVEEVHARQAAATQDIWRDVPAAPPPPAPPTSSEAPAAAPAAAIGAVMAPPVSARGAAPFAVAPGDEAPVHMVAPDDDELAPRRRGWWQSTPPLARLAIVVGVLLLSLPVIGYVVGMVKDERPPAESSYPPAGGIVAAADAEAPIDAAPELPAAQPEPDPVQMAEAGPPIDLTAQTIPAEPLPVEPATEPGPPIVTGAGAAETVEPAPARTAQAESESVPEPAVAAAPRVFVHYSSEQPGAADAAAQVADNLRAQGFAVADIRAVPIRIETASVRYFHPGDRANAEALHDALGGALRGRGFSAGDLKSMNDYDPSPRPGTLEVWVPSDS